MNITHAIRYLITPISLIALSHSGAHYQDGNQEKIESIVLLHNAPPIAQKSTFEVKIGRSRSIKIELEDGYDKDWKRKSTKLNQLFIDGVSAEKKGIHKRITAMLSDVYRVNINGFYCIPSYPDNTRCAIRINMTAQALDPEKWGDDDLVCTIIITSPHSDAFPNFEDGIDCQVHNEDW